MSDIITTLHPENDNETNLYPNIQKANIPNRSIDMAKLDRSIEALLNNIGELHPSGVDTSAHILAYTTDKGIYIGSDTGHWYYWNGTQYADGGVYQATAIADGSIVLSQLANSLKDILAYGDGILSSDINDLNDVRLYNKFVRVTSAKTQQQLANCPYYSFQGVIYTFYTDESSVCVLQIVQNASGSLYYRTKWSSWSSWKTLVTSDNFSSFFSNVLSLNSVIKEYEYTNYTNLDNVPRNSVISYTSTSGITNQPDGRQGVLLTFGSNDITKTQIYVSAGNAIYCRRLWGTTWYGWNRIIDETNINEYLNDSEYLDILSAFNNITCIGDSLTYSQVYTSSSTSRQAYQTYPMCLQKKTGVPTVNLARAGFSPINWWNYFSNDLEEKTNQLAIIYLGTNGGLTDTLATDCVGDDYTQWADTNTGDYAKIVAKCKSLDMKVILLKVWTTGGDLTTTNDVIEQIATRFGCAVCDSINLTELKYHYYPDLSGSNSVHYNDLGYSAFTDKLIHEISNLSNDEMKLIIPE